MRDSNPRHPRCKHGGHAFLSLFFDGPDTIFDNLCVKSYPEIVSGGFMQIWLKVWFDAETTKVDLARS